MATEQIILFISLLAIPQLTFAPYFIMVNFKYTEKFSNKWYNKYPNTCHLDSTILLPLPFYKSIHFTCQSYSPRCFKVNGSLKFTFPIYLVLIRNPWAMTCTILKELYLLVSSSHVHDCCMDYRMEFNEQRRFDGPAFKLLTVAGMN